jgi:hypothetical protein
MSIESSITSPKRIDYYGPTANGKSSGDLLSDASSCKG